MSPQVAATAKAARPAAPSHDPAAAASISRAVLPAPAAGRAPFATWIAVAAVAVAAALAGIVFLQRPSGSPSGTTTSTTNPGGWVEAADPGRSGDDNRETRHRARGREGPIDGRDVGLVTPVDVAIADITGSRVRVTKAGYKPADVRAAQTQIKNGMVLVRLDAAATSIAVTVSGGYPFEGRRMRVVSAASTHHEFSVPGPRVLRLRAADYMLDAPLRAESGTGRVWSTVPEPGRLTIRSRSKRARSRSTTRERVSADQRSEAGCRR